MKCVTRKCDKNVQHFEISDKNAIIPTECDIGELRGLFSYFQYRAPNIESAHSPLLEFSRHDKTLKKILKTIKNNKFCPHNLKLTDTEIEFANMALNGTHVCSYCKRFLCKRMPQKAKRDNTRPETNLECLLRHLRNALAHGHVFVIHGGNFVIILFEDKNDKGNTTARIICRQSDLKKWRKILNDEVKDQTERENQEQNGQ